MNASDIDTKEALMGARTHGKQQQEILFKAAADLYKLAASIGYETDDPSERRRLQGAIDNTDWLARQVENLGHEQAVASTRVENRLARLRAAVETSTNLLLKETIVARTRGFNVDTSHGPRAAECISSAVTDAIITGSRGATHTISGNGMTESSATVSRSA